MSNILNMFPRGGGSGGSAGSSIYAPLTISDIPVGSEYTGVPLGIGEGYEIMVDGVPSTAFSSAIYGHGMYVAYSGKVCYTSTDGIHFSTAGSIDYNIDSIYVVEEGGFYILDRSDYYLYFTEDFITIERRGMLPYGSNSNYWAHKICVGGGLIVCTYFRSLSNGESAYFACSSNGGKSFTQFHSERVYTHIYFAYGNGIFVGAWGGYSSDDDAQPTKVMVYTGGTSYSSEKTLVTTDSWSTAEVDYMHFDGKNFILRSGYGSWYSSDGVSWTTQTLPSGIGMLHFKGDYCFEFTNSPKILEGYSTGVASTKELLYCQEVKDLLDSGKSITGVNYNGNKYLFYTAVGKVYEGASVCNRVFRLEDSYSGELNSIINVATPELPDTPVIGNYLDTDIGLIPIKPKLVSDTLYTLMYNGTEMIFKGLTNYVEGTYKGTGSAQNIDLYGTPLLVFVNGNLLPPTQYTSIGFMNTGYLTSSTVYSYIAIMK
jgi:hypothetical protein